MQIKPFYKYVDNKLVRGKYMLSPLKIKHLKNQNINQVIDLRDDFKIVRDVERFFCKMFGIKYINRPYSFRDKNFVPKDFFLDINKLITENKGTTYIHCKIGKHRTGLCVAAYKKEVMKKSNREIIYDLYEHDYDDLSKYRESLTRALSNFAKMFDLR